MSPLWIESHAALVAEAGQHSDEALQASIQALGVPLDDESLERLTRNFPSVQLLTEWLVKEHRLADSASLPLSLWSLLLVLWNRRWPQRPNVESLQQLLSQGQAAAGDGLPAAWVTAWQTFTGLWKKYRFDSLNDFDACFPGEISLAHWLPRLIQRLDAAAGSSPEHDALRAAIRQEVLRLCDLSDDPFSTLATELRRPAD